MGTGAAGRPAEQVGIDRRNQEHAQAALRTKKGESRHERQDWEDRTGLLSLMVVFMFAAGACGEEEKPTIIFSDLNWDSAQLQNAIAARIVSAGTGTRPTRCSAARCR